MPHQGTLTYEEVLREIKSCVDQITLLHQLEDTIAAAQNGEDVSSIVNCLTDYVRSKLVEITPNPRENQ